MPVNRDFTAENEYTDVDVEIVNLHQHSVEIKHGDNSLRIPRGMIFGGYDLHDVDGDASLAIKRWYAKQEGL